MKGNRVIQLNTVQDVHEVGMEYMLSKRSKGIDLLKGRYQLSLCGHTYQDTEDCLVDLREHLVEFEGVEEITVPFAVTVGMGRLYDVRVNVWKATDGEMYLTEEQGEGSLW